MTNSTYYARTSQAELERLVANLTAAAAPAPAGTTYGSEYEYDADRNIRRDAGRHLEMVRAEIAYREKNPGAREREAASNAKWFGIPVPAAFAGAA